MFTVMVVNPLRRRNFVTARWGSSTSRWCGGIENLRIDENAIQTRQLLSAANSCDRAG